MNGDSGEPHDVPMTVLGAGLLWFGWFGFNAGSALSAGGLAASAFVVTNTAAAAATITWVGASYLRTRKVSVVGAACGVGGRSRRHHAGLGLRHHRRSPRDRPRRRRSVLQRDAPAGPLDASTTRSTSSPSMAIGGMFGAIATGIFATSAVQEAYSGLIDGNPGQVGTQLLAVGATIGYAVVATFIIVKVVDLVLGIRVPSAQEERGLDLAVHGEAAYQA